MFRNLRSWLSHLPVLMVAALVTLVVLTALAIGLPAVYMIRQQLEQQAWELLAQGERNSEAALFARWQALNDLALLTSQRPTLQRLVQQGSPAELQAYMETLQVGAGVDAILLCEAGGRLQVQAGALGDPAACGFQPYRSLYRTGTQAWLLAIYPLLDGQGRTVVVADALDASLAGSLGAQTGLEYLFVVNQRPLAASFSDAAQAWQAMLAASGGQAEFERLAFTLDGAPYYAARWDAGLPGVLWISALRVDNIADTQARLTGGLLGAMLVVMLFSSAVGVFLAQRVSRPLQRLRASAVALRMGDLATPIQTLTRVQEITQVAAALEDARIALQHGLAELQREKEWTDHLLESVAEGILTLDRSGRITFFSRGAERITGWKADDVIGRPVDAVFQPVQGSEPLSSALAGSGSRQALALVRLAGREASLAVTAARLAPPQSGRAGMLPGAVTALVFRDVSDEAAMHRLLGDFLADITHEFRTPLSALAASMELLIDQLPSLSGAELEELLGALRLGVLGLQTLIDNLLEGASIEAGRFRVQARRADLEKILKDAERTMRPLYEKYRRTLVIELQPDLPAVRVDPRRTQQVLVNLLSNAVKWSPEHSQVLVRQAWQAEAGMVRVGVADCGPGVPPERRGDLFTRFAHSGSGGRGDVGAGIGLSVVKAIVEAQGGQVGMIDRPGGGAEFWFTLPVDGGEEDTL
ncbi:MAG: sensor histidine kinase [Chloroflexota bacterium]